MKKRRRIKLGDSMPRRRGIVRLALDLGYFLSATECAALEICLEESHLDNDRQIVYATHQIRRLRAERPHRVFLDDDALLRKWESERT